MAAEQSKTQAITKVVIATARAAIMVIGQADNLVNNARPVHTVPK